MAEWPIPGGVLLDLDLSPGCDRVAASDINGTAWIWSVPDGELLAVLTGHSSRVVDVEFSPDGELLLTASWDMAARIWDLRVMQQPVEALIAAIVDDWGQPLEAQ